MSYFELINYLSTILITFPPVCYNLIAFVHRSFLRRNGHWSSVNRRFTRRSSFLHRNFQRYGFYIYISYICATIMILIDKVLDPKRHFSANSGHVAITSKPTITPADEKPTLVACLLHIDGLAHSVHIFDCLLKVFDRSVGRLRRRRLRRQCQL
jgi:hypothetical protein